jgi:hypothetical protein
MRRLDIGAARPALAPRKSYGRRDPHPRPRTVLAGAAGMGSSGGDNPDRGRDREAADVAEATRPHSFAMAEASDVLQFIKQFVSPCA